MPRYNVALYNAESGMLHSQYENVLASDEDTATNTVLETVKKEIGYQTSADGGMATASLPRFRTAVTPAN